MAQSQQRFEHGQLVATSGALELLGELEISPSCLLECHLTGDWGEVGQEDWKENERSVKHGWRVLSVYQLDKALAEAAGEQPDPRAKVWILTEADRSVTTILLPSEY